MKNKDKLHLKKTIYIKTFYLITILLVLFYLASIFSVKNSFLTNIEYFFDTLKYKITNLNIGHKELSIEGQSNSIPALVYHGIVKTPDRFSTTKQGFLEQMSSLKKAGYETISMQDFYDFIYNKKELPKKSFVLTFDDGRKDSYYGADPILKSLGYKATMFIATGVSLPNSIQDKQSTYYLNPDEIKEMESTGRWNIESHAVQKEGGFVPMDISGTQGNFLSNKKWIIPENRLETNEEYQNRITDELTLSKSSIETDLQKKVIAFSYPFGDYGQQTKNLERTYAEKIINDNISKNYKLAFFQTWPVDEEFSQNYRQNKPLFLKRIEPSPSQTGEELLAQLEAGEQKELPFTDTFEKNNGWRSTWGDLITKDSRLETKASNITSGSFAFLDGTLLWDNYVYTNNFKWVGGSHISLVARYNDFNNYTDCTFSDDTVRIQQRVADTVTTLAEVKTPYIFNKEDVDLSIAVRKNTVECFIGNSSILKTTKLDSSLDNGGIGIKTWDPILGVTDVVIKKVSVQAIDSNSQPAKLLPENTLQKVVVITPGTPEIPKPEPIPTTTPITPIALPYSVTDFTGSTLWKNQWGNSLINYDALLVGAVANTTGGFATLNGSNDWKNYSVTFKPKSIVGATFSIVGRYTDPLNYVTCTYQNTGTRGYARIDKTVAGVKTQVGTSQAFQRYFPYKWEGLPFTMSVNGDKVSCLANGSEVLSGTATNISLQGGIGIKTWDSTIGRSVIQLQELYVEGLNY